MLNSTRGYKDNIFDPYYLYCNLGFSIKTKLLDIPLFVDPQGVLISGTSL